MFSGPPEAEEGGHRKAIIVPANYSVRGHKGGTWGLSNNASLFGALSQMMLPSGGSLFLLVNVQSFQPLLFSTLKTARPFRTGLLFWGRGALCVIDLICLRCRSLELPRLAGRGQHRASPENITAAPCGNLRQGFGFKWRNLYAVNCSMLTGGVFLL